MGEPLGSIRRGSRLFANWKYMEYFHFVTDVRAIFVFTLDFQFVLDLREYSSMYLKSRGGDFFFIRKSFYFEIFGMYWGISCTKSIMRSGGGYGGCIPQYKKA
jgi:hypothetical protein